MTSQFDLNPFYDVIIRNSVFQLGFLTREFQIPKNVTISVFEVFNESINFSTVSAKNDNLWLAIPLYNLFSWK